MKSKIADQDVGEADIRVLEPDDIERLRLGWWSRFDADDVQKRIGQMPGVSVWSPSTSEYLLAGPWRHRLDIVYVVELLAIRHPVELMRRAIAEARAAGIKLFLAVEMAERRQPVFYERSGLQQLEDVVSYELTHVRDRPKRGMTSNISAAGALDDVTLRELHDVDWNAFPWIWRNSDDEFREYVTQPGVEIHVLREGSVPIGYIGISSYPGWGHIDRIAVKKPWQGRGFGRQLTEYAIDRLVALGATKIGLSTQQRNDRSQSLYETLGFRRQSSGEYRIYGAVLTSGDSIEELVMG